MPGRTDVVLFELGVRLTQCMRVFPIGVEDIEYLTPAYRRALLHRLQNVIDVFLEAEGDHGAAQTQARRIMEDIFGISLGSMEPKRDDVHGLLIVLKSRIENWIETRLQDDRHTLWFQLGVAIADGSGNLTEERLYYSDQSILASETAVPASWQNRNEDGLRRAPEQMNVWEDFPGLETICPIHEVNDDAMALLPGTPDIYWGWTRWNSVSSS